MEYPNETKFFITHIDLGDIDMLGSGNNEFKPQSGITIGYKLFSYIFDEESQRRKKVVLGGGNLSIPIYNDNVKFDYLEQNIINSIKDHIQDLTIASEELLIHNNMVANATSILESENNNGQI